MKSCSLALTAIATLLAASAAPLSSRGTTINLVNQSYENDVVSDGTHTTSIAGWTTVTGNTVATDQVTTYNPTATDFAGAGGNNSAAGMNGANVLDLRTSTINATGVVTQSTTVPLTQGSTYTFTIAVGNSLNDLFHGYTISLTAGGTVLNSVTGTEANVPDGTWKDITVSYTPNATDPVIAQLISQGAPVTVSLSSNGLASLATGQIASVQFDYARLSYTTVPEPSAAQAMSLGLLGLGALSVARRRFAPRRA